MPTINTLTGPVDTAELGGTLIHEHITIRSPGIGENWPELWDHDGCVTAAREKLAGLPQRGIGTVVDLTTADMGRDIAYLQEVGGFAPVNVVLATGIYWVVPLYWHERPIEQLVDVFVHDITVGIQGTQVKAGIIKLASDKGARGVDRVNEKCLRAGARAQRATGVPIATHNNPPELGREQQRVFKDEGVDLSRVVIGHVGDTTDTDYLKELMDNGSYVGMDRFGLDMLLPFEDRVATVAALCADGYSEQILLAHDANCCLDWIADPAAMAEQLPNWHFNHISDDVLPALRERGVSDAQIDTMLVANARRLFEQQGPY